MLIVGTALITTMLGSSSKWKVGSINSFYRHVNQSLPNHPQGRESGKDSLSSVWTNTDVDSIDCWCQLGLLLLLTPIGKLLLHIQLPWHGALTPAPGTNPQLHCSKQGPLMGNKTSRCKSRKSIIYNQRLPWQKTAITTHYCGRMTLWTDKIIGFLYVLFFLLSDFFLMCVYSSNHYMRVPNEKFLLYRRLPVLKEKSGKLDGHLLQKK